MAASFFKELARTTKKIFTGFAIKEFLTLSYFGSEKKGWMAGMEPIMGLRRNCTRMRCDGEPSRNAVPPPLGCRLVAVKGRDAW